MSRSGLVLALYGALAMAGILISAGRHDVDVYRLAEVSTPSRLLYSPFIGVAVGLFVVALSRLATARFGWARRLHRDFRDLLGPLTGREILILAAASSIGEEILFRGALLPWLGLWPQAVIFALLHVGPGARFLPWTASALGMAAGYDDVPGKVELTAVLTRVMMPFLLLISLSSVAMGMSRPPAEPPDANTLSRAP